MNPAQQDILNVLSIERMERNLYRGQNHNSEHVFGGQVFAQAIAAAFQTVRAEHHLHSVHGYFLRAGDWQVPIIYEVDPIRDGRSFSTRRVVAIQHGRAIFELASSWHKIEPSQTHALPMPDVPPPDALRGDREAYRAIEAEQPEVRRFSFRFDAIDSRPVERLLMHNADKHPPYKHTWLKMRDPLPDDECTHLALLAYMSDLDFMSTSLLPHSRSPGGGDLIGASLDHSLWVHRRFRADEWLLFAKTSPNASGARGFVRGQFFNRAGELVVTAAQECLIRPIAPPVAPNANSSP